MERTTTVKLANDSKWSMLVRTVDGGVTETEIVGGLTIHGDGRLGDITVRVAGVRVRTPGLEPQDVDGQWLADVTMQPEEYQR